MGQSIDRSIVRIPSKLTPTDPFQSIDPYQAADAHNDDTFGGGGGNATATATAATAGGVDGKGPLPAFFEAGAAGSGGGEVRT